MGFTVITVTVMILFVFSLCYMKNSKNGIEILQGHNFAKGHYINTLNMLGQCPCTIQERRCKKSFHH